MPHATYEAVLTNAINGRSITRKCATRDEAEQIARTERPFNNTRSEVREVHPRKPVKLIERKRIAHYEYPRETITIVEHTYDNGHRYQITRTISDGWSMIRISRLDWNDWFGRRIDFKHPKEPTQ